MKDDIQKIVEDLNADFTRRLIEYLSDELSDLETETAIGLLKCLMRDIATYEIEIDDVVRRRMSKYLHGMSLYEYTSDIIRPLIRYYYSKTDKIELDEEEERVLVAKCLQLKPWREIEGEGYKKYKTLMKAVQKIWRWYRDKVKASEH